MNAIEHPTHYTSHPSGVEAIEVVEWLPFNLGNAIKYLWRAGLKGAASEDHRKALWYLRRELARLREIGAYGSPKPRRAREAALRALEKCPEGLLRDVLLAIFSKAGEYATALDLLEAATRVQCAIDPEAPFVARYTPIPPRAIEETDRGEVEARTRAAEGEDLRGQIGTITTTKAVTL